MRRLARLNSNYSRRGARRSGRSLGGVRGAITGGVASALVVVGAVAFATPAYAQDATQSTPGSSITSTASCNSPLGTGVQITWTLANDSNVPETGSVTTVTGGSGTLNATTYTIPPSSRQSTETATLTQALPDGTPGVITLEVSSTWADGHSQIDTGTFNLSTMSCAAPHQTIAGHIYLCNEGNPTTTEETGGTLAANGTGLSTVPPASNPSAPTGVTAGTYTMTATDPPGFHLATCGGSSSPDGAGTSATESVSVPSGGAGEGLFYADSDTSSGVNAGTSSGVSTGTSSAELRRELRREPGTVVPLGPYHADGRRHLVARSGRVGEPASPRGRHRQRDAQSVRDD